MVCKFCGAFADGAATRAWSMIAWKSGGRRRHADLDRVHGDRSSSQQVDDRAQSMIGPELFETLLPFGAVR